MIFNAHLLVQLASFTIVSFRLKSRIHPKTPSDNPVPLGNMDIRLFPTLAVHLSCPLAFNRRLFLRTASSTNLYVSWKMAHSTHYLVSGSPLLCLSTPTLVARTLAVAGRAHRHQRAQTSQHLPCQSSAHLVPTGEPHWQSSGCRGQDKRRRNVPSSSGRVVPFADDWCWKLRPDTCCVVEAVLSAVGVRPCVCTCVSVRRRCCVHGCTRHFQTGVFFPKMPDMTDARLKPSCPNSLRTAHCESSLWLGCLFRVVCNRMYTYRLTCPAITCLPGQRGYRYLLVVVVVVVVVVWLLNQLLLVVFMCASLRLANLQT
ncbi:unnamed protein product [Protopolystoma xenopodis]|uniref:Uncharacterized protein n=1 Tax=Protopolystoma xenopodis TaxID=117903 RepID=A0A3S5A030_9PLAT|nr:unnamed protein product [Protopolystoma xenopodis]